MSAVDRKKSYVCLKNLGRTAGLERMTGEKYLIWGPGKETQEGWGVNEKQKQQKGFSISNT